MINFYNSVRRHPLVTALFGFLSLTTFAFRIQELVKWLTQSSSSHDSSAGYDGFWGVMAYAVQAFVIGIVLVIVSRAPYTNTGQQDLERPNMAIEQFHFAWRGVWWAWFWYYLVVFIHSLLKAKGSEIANGRFWEPTQTLLNNIQAIFLFGCYYILAKPTVPSKDSKSSPTPIYAALVVVFTFLTLGHAFYAASQPGTAPSAHLADSQGRLLFHLVSGVASGVALALFVGRLDSKYIDVPQWIIITLSAYALLQPTYILFVSDEFGIFEGVLSAIALPLKLLLFYCIHWFLLKEDEFSNSRSLFYFHSIKEVYEMVGINWGKFNQEYPPPSKEDLPPEPPPRSFVASHKPN